MAVNDSNIPRNQVPHTTMEASENQTEKNRLNKLLLFTIVVCGMVSFKLSYDGAASIFKDASFMIPFAFTWAIQVGIFFALWHLPKIKTPVNFLIITLIWGFCVSFSIGSAFLEIYNSSFAPRELKNVLEETKQQVINVLEETKEHTLPHDKDPIIDKYEILENKYESEVSGKYGPRGEGPKSRKIQREIDTLKPKYAAAIERQKKEQNQHNDIINNATKLMGKFSAKEFKNQDEVMGFFETDVRNSIPSSYYTVPEFLTPKDDPFSKVATIIGKINSGEFTTGDKIAAWVATLIELLALVMSIARCLLINDKKGSPLAFKVANIIAWIHSFRHVPQISNKQIDKNKEEVEHWVRVEKEEQKQSHQSNLQELGVELEKKKVRSVTRESHSEKQKNFNNISTAIDMAIGRDIQYGKAKNMGLDKWKHELTKASSAQNPNLNSTVNSKLTKVLQDELPTLRLTLNKFNIITDNTVEGKTIFRPGKNYSIWIDYLLEPPTIKVNKTKISKAPLKVAA